MKIYLKENVYEAALNRIRYLFDEFPNIIVNFSGGKDSTVIFNLALQVAKEKNQLPLTVCFIDQEAEWDATIDYIRKIMYRDDVNPRWYQMPIKISSISLLDDKWLSCWQEGREWIREKEEIAIKENIYGTDRFAHLFGKITEKEYGNIPVIRLYGIRAEESPGRFMGMSCSLTYKNITWGTVNNKKLNHYSFSPIYDWSYTDVWKYIHDNNIEYCKLYDYMYNYGIPVQEMRVSNVHHETAIRSLFFMQEIEPDNYNRFIKRMKGINTAKILKYDFFIINELPYMFKSWIEYRDYLFENLITDKEVYNSFKNIFRKYDQLYTHKDIRDYMAKVCIDTILTNDYHKTKFKNFQVNPKVNAYRKWKLKGIIREDSDKIASYNSYIISAINEEKASNIKSNMGPA